MTQRLHHGQFFGTGEARVSVEGFALSIAAVDPERPVVRLHAHVRDQPGSVPAPVPVVMVARGQDGAAAICDDEVCESHS